MSFSLVVAMLLMSQDLGSMTPPRAVQHQSVAYTAEPQVIAAGKQANLELHFRVLEGFHINSHQPGSELLIPTKLELGATEKVKAGAILYPAGKPFSFSFDPGSRLDVYAGEFTLHVPVQASSGQHELTGSLQYQACDKALCYPPRKLPVSVIFTAK